MPSSTSRWGLPFPELSDVADVPGAMQDLAEALDDVAMDDQGAIDSRPAAATAKSGAYYYATDTTEFFRSDGTSWVPIERPRELVSSLPGSPTDGQEVYYLADATNGVIW